MPGRVAPLDMAGVTVPYHFRCPISLELMRDPVTVSTGQTYDRSSIESWVAAGHATCPVTRAHLSDVTLIPNHTLRRLIQDWCVAHRSLGVERIPTPKQPAEPSDVLFLLSSASPNNSSASRLAALRRLRDLARESEKNRAIISTLETRSALIEIAFEDSDSGSYLDLDLDPAMEAMAVLAMLPLSESESTAVTARPERLRRLGRLVRGHPAVEARISAATVIEAVAAGARSAEARAAVGATEGVLEGLVSLLEERRPPQRAIGAGKAVRVGLRELFALCLAKVNRARAIASGAATAVARRVAELAGGDAERALATVELLCRAGEGGREAVVDGFSGGSAAVRALVRAMSGKSSQRAAEHAAGALVAVVGGSAALQREAVAAGVVPQLLLMVQGGCSDRAKRKAQLLLKLLRPAWPIHDSIANSDEFFQQF